MTTTVWVPCDAASVSVGADAVADALAAAGATVRRNGSRGMLWLEPLVEVETDAGRIGFSTVTPGQVATSSSGALRGTDQDLGVVDEHPWLARQHRVSFARVGVIEPTDLAAYRAHGGLAGLERALTLTAEEVVREVTDSGLRGRGGAGFPAGIKWQTVPHGAGRREVRLLQRRRGRLRHLRRPDAHRGRPVHPHRGDDDRRPRRRRHRGLRLPPQRVSRTPSAPCAGHRHRRTRTACSAARCSAAATASTCDVRVGAGAYICGEETSMLESLEGKRGEVRAKPPLPALAGLFGKPTVVNNVLTLAAVPMVLADGGAAYAALGTGRSRGTQVFQLGGNVAHGGIVEADFGITLRELVEDFGGGTASAGRSRPCRSAARSARTCRRRSSTCRWTTRPSPRRARCSATAASSSSTTSMDTGAMARFAMEFCAKESCGKCTPVPGRVDPRRRGHRPDPRRGRGASPTSSCSRTCATTMAKGSLCAMGGLTPMPVRSALEHWPEDFGVPAGAADAVIGDSPESATSTDGGARP